MQKRTMTLASLLVIAAMALSACGVVPQNVSDQVASALQDQIERTVQQQLDQLLPAPGAAQGDQSSPEAAEPAQSGAQQAPQSGSADSGLLAAYEQTLANIYELVNPSVVNIRVLTDATAMLPGTEILPGLPEDHPQVPQPDLPFAVGQGSGFVWDKDGHIVTNNHVIEGANRIQVTFSDGTVAEASLVGADPDSDLAVIKVDLPDEKLLPVTVADSDQARVGDLVIAIGNPFGLNGTMTVGIISALERSVPASELGFQIGANYRIPDVIQTDASINPGNSGGVLVNTEGQVVGVTFAIESPVRANSGVGFVIPSSIVKRVAPALIEKGVYEHPYLGISGISLTPDLAKAMNLDAGQRGALVSTVVPDGPADKAGLLPSEDETTIDGLQVNVGGDVIVGFQGMPVLEIDQLISYLSSQGQVGQRVTLDILRDGKQQSLEVTLGARPAQEARVAESDGTQPPQEEQPPAETQPSGQVYLGIMGTAVTPEIADAMDLNSDQQGVLVVEVQPDSPANRAGLRAGTEQVDIQGRSVTIGGDVITAFNGQKVSTIEALAEWIQSSQVGDQVTLTILRNGQEMDVKVTLAERSQ